MNFRENYSLQSHNTLALQQSADFFVMVMNESELLQAHQFAKDKKMPLLLLGEGSNLVLSRNYPGLVVQNAIHGIQVVSEDARAVTIDVGAGEHWHDLVQHTLAQHWFGLENLALIPGTVGAAPVQNIGAYGVEIREFIASVRVFDTYAGEWKILDNSDCAFSYRDSVFKKSFSLHQANRYLITSVRLILAREAKVNIHYQALRDYLAQRVKSLDTITPRQVFDAVVDIRRSRLPDPVVMPNAGSFFKNPIVPLEQYERLLKKFPALVSYPAGALHRKLAAAWLIDQAGWRGVQEGQVAVHQQQALVLVNHGATSGAELLVFANKIRSDIQQRYGIDLEMEPTVI